MARIGLVVGGHWEALSGALEHPDFLVLPRHGSGATREGAQAYVLPHEIDHSANMRALLEAGCDSVLAVGSVGGLHPDLAPGAFVCPDDFIALDAPPRTALRGVAAHRVPGFDLDWRRELVGAFAAARGEAGVELRDGGVYWQATGPRLETPAEIRFLARHADVIGMTIGSECVAAGELGLRHAAVCVVDNFANGVAATELTLAEVEAGRARNRGTLARTLAAVLTRLA